MLPNLHRAARVSAAYRSQSFLSFLPDMIAPIYASGTVLSCNPGESSCHLRGVCFMLFSLFFLQKFLYFANREDPVCVVLSDSTLLWWFLLWDTMHIWVKPLSRMTSTLVIKESVVKQHYLIISRILLNTSITVYGSNDTA